MSAKVALAAAALAACGCAVGSSEGPSELEAPATVSVVSVADVDLGWPIGDWRGSTFFTTKCDDGSSHSDSQDYRLTVAAGAGLDYKVTTVSAFPGPFCDWAGTPSADGRAVLGAPASCTGMTLETVSLQLAGEDPVRQSRNAEVYATGTLAGCHFAFEDFRVSRDGTSPTAVAGRHDETLAAPLPLVGWGVLDAAGTGQDVDVATFRRTLALDVVGTPPGALVFDPNGYALQEEVDGPVFDVFASISNTSTQPTCFAGAAIQAVNNAVGLPVTTEPLLPIVDAPVVGDATCLRPGERAWLRSSVIVTDEASFHNAARLRVTAPSTTLLGGTRRTIATPFRARQSPGHGLEIDFVGDPSGAATYFLDDTGALVGFNLSRDVFPRNTSRPEVSTVTLPPHAALGHPVNMAVYPTTSPL